MNNMIQLNQNLMGLYKVKEKSIYRLIRGSKSSRNLKKLGKRKKRSEKRSRNNKKVVF